MTTQDLNQKIINGDVIRLPLEHEGELEPWQIQWQKNWHIAVLAGAIAPGFISVPSDEL